MVRPDLVTAHFVHTHTHTKECVSSCVVRVLLEQSYGYLHHLDWVIMLYLISFHAQNTAECENAVLTLRALVLCDKPFLNNYEVSCRIIVIAILDQ
jgi:hypothetical protein